jgi:hypothetical protein
MTPFVPKRLEQVAFGLFLTFFMTFIITGISTVLAVGPDATGFARLWFVAWMSSWAVAFPAVLVVAPFVRRILRVIVRPA